MHFIYASKIAIISFGALLLLAACESIPSGIAATAVPNAVTAAPTASVAASPSPAPTPSSIPAEPTATLAPLEANTIPTVPAPNTLEPTTAPPSSTPAPPTATLAPLEANTIPESGEFDDELPFSTTANDPSIGSNSGDGIDNVTFQFFDPDGNLVYTRTENNSLYCAFGGGDNGQDCDRWLFSEHQNQWPNGKPAQSGLHTIVVTIRGVNGGTARNERQATLKLP
jgi:hypothetical protein